MHNKPGALPKKEIALFAFNCQRTMKAIVINVPGSKLNGPITRRQAFEVMWKMSGMEKDWKMEFLSNTCTPVEIHKEKFVKRHDTFVPKPLQQYWLGATHASLSLEEKAKAYQLNEDYINANWDTLVLSLLENQLNCAAATAVGKQLNEPPSEILRLILDTVRTKLTRTACTESHVRAYTELRKSEEPVGLILEDDLTMLPGLCDQIRQIQDWLKLHEIEWNLVQLGWSKHSDRSVMFNPESPIGMPIKGVYGNTALLVNLQNNTPGNVTRLIHVHRRDDAVIKANDVVLAESSLRIFVAKERLVGPPAGNHESVVAGKAMDYDQYCWDPEKMDEVKKVTAKVLEECSKPQTIE
jgi:hypothetical protein